MPLSGLEIYKHLPKGNCKECGLPTCLAFAMKVASGQTTLEECPRLDEKAKAALGEASAPPQQLVNIGAGDRAFAIGQEAVLYRHEDKFYHPTAIGVCVSDHLSDEAIEGRCRDLAAISFDRMGKVSQLDLIAVFNVSGSAQRFAEAARKAAQSAKRPVALISGDPDTLREAGRALAAERPLLWAMDAAGRIDDVVAVAKELSLPLCLQGAGFDGVCSLTEKARAAGLKELILSPGNVTEADGLEFLTQSRRAAIVKKFRPMGYPVAIQAMDEDRVRSTVAACWYVLKYAGIVITDLTRPEQLLPIFATRQDIYTNPQIPVQVTPGLHTIGEPGPDAPVLLTTNFALSYYSVESEIASSRIPAYVIAVDTEGTSVLTAWAAEKLTATTVSDALNKNGIGQKVRHKKVIIPGLVAVLSGGIKDESGWEVLVGPREASGIVSFLKNQWKP
jgi:acetyl-CoA decarbonylase/synthase complex subunit gamma